MLVVGVVGADLGGRHFVGGDCLGIRIGRFDSDGGMLNGDDHLCGLAQVFDIFEHGQLTDVDGLTDSQAGDVDFDVIGQLGGAAADFEFVQFLVDDPTVVLHAYTGGLTLEVHGDLSGESMATLDLLEINVLDRTLNRVVLNILHKAEGGFTGFVGQFDKCGTAANLTIEVAEIHRRNGDGASVALPVEGGGDISVRTEATGDTTTGFVAIGYFKCILLHV